MIFPASTSASSRDRPPVSEWRLRVESDAFTEDVEPRIRTCSPSDAQQPRSRSDDRWVLPLLAPGRAERVTQTTRVSCFLAGEMVPEVHQDVRERVGDLR